MIQEMNMLEQIMFSLIYALFRDCHQILLLISCEFKRINKLCPPPRIIKKPVGIVLINPLTTNNPIIQKQVNWFALQINRLVFIWWRLLVINGLIHSNLGNFEAKIWHNWISLLLTSNMFYCLKSIIFNRHTHLTL